MNYIYFYKQFNIKINKFMGKQLLLNISEQVNLHINILICVLFLNIILIIFEIFRKLPRNIFIDKPLNIY